MTCHHCEKKHLSRKKLKRHIQSRHQRALRKCKFCGLMFLNANAVVEHQVAAHRQKCLTCGQCEKKFITARQLKLHEISHSSAMPFSCDFCEKKFRHPNSIVQHMGTHQRHKNFQNGLNLRALVRAPPLARNETCDICGEFVENVFKHKLTHHKPKLEYICKFCNKKLSDKRALNIHLLHAHGHIVDDVKAGIMVCHFCGKKFLRRLNLIRHLRGHREKPRICRFCRLEFPNSNAWVDHQVATHGSKCFVCTKCDKKFTNAGDLLRHGRVHSLVMPFSCDICEKKFRYRTGFLEHNKTHLPRSDLRCKICAASCSNEKKLKDHMESVHTEISNAKPNPVVDVAERVCEKPSKCTNDDAMVDHQLAAHGGQCFTCKKCNKIFLTLLGFRKHEDAHSTSVSTGQPFSCDICGKHFRRRECIRDHMKSHRRQNVEVELINHTVFHKETVAETKPVVNRRVSRRCHGVRQFQCC
jgi:KRAB domain-containing zinc finger protein